MTSIPPIRPPQRPERQLSLQLPPPRGESIRAEASRRGVTTHTVRSDRAQTGKGAPTGHIKWGRLPSEQREAIREYIARSKWGKLVKLIIANQDYYKKTTYKLNQHDYYEGIQDIIDYSWVGEREAWAEKVIKWYHPTRG